MWWFLLLLMVSSVSLKESGIKDGTVASADDYPFMVSVKQDGSHVCGGTLIYKDVVLTAAHCVSDDSPSAFEILAGTTNLKSGGKTVKVKDILLNHEYNARQTTNDIALLLLDNELELSDSIKTIKLHCKENEIKEKCIIAGWGQTSENGNIPDDLQYVEVETLPQNTCRSEMKKASVIVSSEICTSTKNGNGVCQGDSGGPLFTKVDEEFHQIGIVSWGIKCVAGYPDVYARVSSFCSWIDQKLGTN